MELGEIIDLEEHRLMRGDARKDIPKLIKGYNVDLLFTDPPYGIDLLRGKKTTIGLSTNEYKPIIGDDEPFDPQHLLDLGLPSILWGGNHYAGELPSQHHWIFWHKQANMTIENSFSDGELAWTNLKGNTVKRYQYTWAGTVREGERRLELSKRIHPTQKPVGLLIKLLEKYTKVGDVILDPYGGSGSTLIACAETGRTCLMMELDEHYCDAIQKRYWDYRKATPRKRFDKKIQTTLI